MKSSVIRTQSIRYVGDDDGPILKFGSLDRGNLDDEDGDYHKNSNLFMYNSEKDIYRLISLKKSRIKSKNSDKDLETIMEEEKAKENNEMKKEEISKDDNMSGGNIIFANIININFKEKKLGPLYIIMLCYLVFCLIELICGYYSKSITLMADAAHYFSESSCFGIYILSIYVSRKRATNIMSFGFHRGEIIGVLVRATFLLGFSFWLIYYISLSFIHPEIVSGLMMIILGIISTFFSLIMGLVLMFVGISNDISFSEKEKNCQHQHSDDELSCNSARKTFTNVIFKSIQSCIIILAGVLIYFLPTIRYIDPCCTIILAGILLFDAFKQMGGVITILMEGSPLEFDVDKLEKDLRKIPGVTEVHDIHVWSLSIGKISMSCHLTTSEPQNSLVKARELIKQKYNITHTTIQVELFKENKKKCKAGLH
jgi:cation diffusion facilitator family transporter